MTLTTPPDAFAGVGLRPHHYPDWHARESSGTRPWLEIMADNYIFDRGGPALHHLRRLAEGGRTLLHGVGLNIGGQMDLDRAYLAGLGRLITLASPAVVSDHLCFTRVPGASSFDLLPIPYTEPMLRHVTARVHAAQDALGVRLSLENVSSYVRYAGSDLTEMEFLAEVCRRTGAGVLLDVNNAFVSAVNHGGDPVLDMAALSADQVTQYHVAGHTEADGYLLDTHDQTVRSEVTALLAHAWRRFGPRPFVLERDDEQALAPLLAELRGLTADLTP
jgi:uncharacterized protein (UPF0276 family)